KKYIKNTHRIEVIDGVEVQVSTHPDVLHIHTSYLDNIENLHPQFLTEVERLKEKALQQATKPDGTIDKAIFNKSKYATKIIGRWSDIAEGVIFTDWEEGDFDYSLPYAYGQDYGFSLDPDTLIKVAVDKSRKRVYVHEEYYDTKRLGTNDLNDVNKSRLRYADDLIIADSAEPRLIADLKELGLNIEACETGDGSVKTEILSLNEYT